jgi:hypothetical protein
MYKLVVAAAILVGLGIQPTKAATQITVDDLGPILNESDAFASFKTPGKGEAFEAFFEFSLPVPEVFSLSMSDSASGNQKITGGNFLVNYHTGNSSTSPFQPTGPAGFIESAPILLGFPGGQATALGPMGYQGDLYAEISGFSGTSPLMISIDGNATAAAPEPSTWVMLGLGFGMLGLVGRRARPERVAAL